MTINYRKPLATLVQHNRLILIVSVAIIAAIGFGMKNLYLETDYKIFFDENDPYLAADDNLKSVYGKSDNILFVIDPHDNEVFSTQTLSAIEELTEQAWSIPYSKRVDSITNYQYASVEGDDIVIDNLVDDARNLSEQNIGKVRAVALGEVGLIGRLISESGKTSAVNVTLNLPDPATTATQESVLRAREIKTAIEKAHPSISVYLAGIVPTEQTFSEIATADAQTLIPLMFVLVSLLLAVILRSVSATVCTILIIIVSAVVSMGFSGWYGMAINNVNISAPTIIMTLAVADCVHIFNTFLASYGRNGNKAEALVYSLHQNIYPVFLTSVTTAFGFLTMNFSESPPFRELGTISAVGVVGAFFASVFVLPGLIMLLPFKQNRQESSVSVLTKWLSDVVILHRKKLFSGLLAVIVLTSSFILKIELNDNPIGYFSSATPVRQASEFIEKNLSGTQIIYYSLDSKAPEGVLEPAFLKSAETFAEWLRSQPEVANVESFTDIIKRLNQIMHDDDSAWFRLPNDRPLTAQYFLMYSLSLPYGLDLSNQISADQSSLKITATLKNQNSQGLLDFEDRVQDWFTRKMPSLQVPGASHSVSFAHIGQRNIESMLFGSLTAVLLISLSLILTFRSIKYGLLSFIPNIFPAVVTLGIWGATVNQVNMAASVVFSLSLGIIVDDTIHFMVKYLSAVRQKKCSAEEAVRYAFANTGSALISTSIALASGFMVLAFSDFTVNSTSGLLVAIIILVAIVLDLLFLPSLLMKVDARIGKK